MIQDISAFTITLEQKEQYDREGFFILRNVLTAQQLEDLRAEAGRFMMEMDAEMDRLRVDNIGITHRGSRYFIGNRWPDSEKLQSFLFSDLMAAVCQATLGDEAYLFAEQFVIKAAEKGMSFGWHQDSGYVGYPHRPYLSCWCALDDMTIENGTVYLLNYEQAGTRDWVRHDQEEGTHDLIGYAGSEEGLAAIVPAGSVVVFSSTAFHRSGANTTENMRRVYLAQYSAEPILKWQSQECLNYAAPFLRDGKKLDGRH